MLKVFKLRPVLKITLSALFIALTIVVSKFLPISNVFNLPFLRISLGPTLLIFASILLGPFYGALTGLLSDLVGFIFDTTGFAYNPLFSLTYLLYGLVPGLLVYLLQKNKSSKPIIQIVSFVIINIFVICFFSLNDVIAPYGGKEYVLDLTTKLIVIFSSLGITLLYFVLYIILYKKFKNKDQRVLLNNISIINFITLIFVQLFIGVIVKKITYEVDIVVLLGGQIIVTTIEILISNYLVCVLYFVSTKMFKRIPERKKKEKIKKVNKKRVILIRRIK